MTAAKSIALSSLILATLAVFLFWGAGTRPLASPDEGRYAEIPREMLSTGDYLTPRLNGFKYFEKPPLFYWMQTLSYKLFGLSEWAVRLANTLMAWLGCLLVFWAGRRLFSWRVGIVAAIVLATSLLYYGISRIVILDMTVSVMITGAIFSMAMGAQHPDASRRRWLFRLGYLFCALGTLTKGIIGIAIPGAVILLWLLATRQGRLIPKMLLPSGIGLFLGLVAPWHILVSLKNPEFAWFYFIHEHFLRLTTQVHQRYQPFWFFIPFFIFGLFPWMTFFIRDVIVDIRTQLWRQPSQKKTLSLLLYIWIGFTLLFYSVSQSKLIPYITPIFPAAALLIARGFDRSWKSRQSPSHAPWGWHIAVTACICLIIFLLSHFFKLTALAYINVTTTILFTVFALGGAIAATFLHRKNPLAGFCALALSAALSFLTIQSAGEDIQRPSAKILAEFLKTIKDDPTTPVVCFGCYPQDFPFYLRQTVRISGWRGELAFGAETEDKRDQLFETQYLLTLWDQHEQVFILTKGEGRIHLKEVLPTCHLIKSYRNLFLFSKKKPS